jgi:4-amino-4-deoxy-L-arabinose transferase-like glycosyltransferase
MKRAALAISLFGLAVGTLLVLKWDTFHDPPFWDGLGGYVGQARFMAAHGFDWNAYRSLDFIRPPLYTGSLAFLIRAGGSGVLALHLATFAVGVLALPAVYAIARRLGGTRPTALLAVALCAVTPMFYTHLGTLQSDMQTTALCALAWACLLADRRFGFAILAALAVVTKESGYFIWLPAAFVIYRRDRPRSVGAVARAIWPLLVPVVTVALWEFAHNAVVGSVITQNYKQNFHLNNVPRALYHGYIEAGRWLLWLAVIPAVWRRRSTELIGTVAAAALLPLVFPFGLPRYMMPAIPLLCAAAAIGIAQLPRPRLVAPAVAVAVLTFLVWTWNVELTDSTGAYHRDANMRYRAVLAVETEAARAVAALDPPPRHVVAAFPMSLVLATVPDDAFLTVPVNAESALPDAPLEALCHYDVLVHDAQGEPNTAYEPLAKAGALKLVTSVGTGPDEIQIYRVTCSAAPSASPADHP